MRDINWYRRQHKAWMAERQAHLDRVDQAEAHTAAAVRQAVDQTTASADQESRVLCESFTEKEAGLGERIAQLENKLGVEQAHYAATHHNLVATEKTLREEHVRLVRATADRDEWMAKCEQIAPTIELLEGQLVDLKVLLDRVRSSMTKKQLADESAILNRKVMAGAVPGRHYQR